MSKYFQLGEFFPPTQDGHSDRVARYKENKKLFLGKHHEIYKQVQGKESDLLYVSINLPSIICKKSADFLYGESAQVSAGKRDDSPEQKAIDRIVKDNDLNITNYESSLSNAYRGDAFYKIRWGQNYGGALPEELDPFRAIIENQNAEYVYPEPNLYDANKIEAFHIAVPIQVDRGKYVLDVESHYSGHIEYGRYTIRPISTDTQGNVDSFTITGIVEGSFTTVLTGVPMPLIVHVPNYSLDDSWQGVDDLSEHKSIFDEINNRISQISQILDKHSDPALAVPSGLLGSDEDGNPTFRVAVNKVFEIMGKDDVMPEYITWNGQLQEAFTELDKLVELLFMMAEIPTVALGKGDSGTSGSSGLAIKWRMNSLLSKINRKRQYYEKALKQVFIVAQLLEHNVGGRSDYEITIPVLRFGDGLPKDELETANIMAIRTKGSQTMSQKTALMIMDGLTEEQADNEIERIKEEQEAAGMFADPSIFNEEITADVAEQGETIAAEAAAQDPTDEKFKRMGEILDNMKM
ncbi:MAG: hypothetical protein K0S71_338 [Clostridia bacterium]|jgi:hypothetical protein|nr:hypothetical protein [Clostridia bacterium]